MTVPRDIPEEARAAAQEAITEEVHNRLSFNVAAYGQPWTGEYEDTKFIVSGAAERAFAAALPFLSAERDAALARAERAEAAVERLGALADELGDAQIDAVARADRLAEALRFYADEVNYIDGVPGEWVTYPGHPGSYTGFEETEFEHDNGERARAALADATTEPARDRYTEKEEG